MYDRIQTEELLKEILEIFKDKNNSFEEKSEFMCYLVRNRNNSIEFMKRYLNVYLENINFKNFKEYSELFYELSKRKLHVVLRDLLNNKEILKYVDIDHCLYFSAEKDHYKNVKLLLEKEADINQYSLRCVYFSIKNKNFDIFTLLLNQKEKILDKEHCLNVVLNSNWSTAINWILKEEFWLSKVNNDIVKHCKKNLSDKQIKIIERANRANKIEVF